MAAIRHPKVLARLETVIYQVRKAPNLMAVRNLKKLEGKQGYYRIRVGNFRIGFEMIGGTAIFLRCLDRKDVYRYFP